MFCLLPSTTSIIRTILEILTDELMPKYKLSLTELKKMIGNAGLLRRLSFVCPTSTIILPAKPIRREYLILEKRRYTSIRTGTYGTIIG